MGVEMAVYLEELVQQYGTNLLKAPLCMGTVLRFEFYGRICTITVTEDGRSAEFAVEG